MSAAGRALIDLGFSTAKHPAGGGQDGVHPSYSRKKKKENGAPVSVSLSGHGVALRFRFMEAVLFSAIC